MFSNLIRTSVLFELVTEPSLALSVFRLCLADTRTPAVLEEVNALNKTFYTRLCSRSDIYLTQTDLNGTFCIRMAIGAVLTEQYHIEAAFKILEEEGEATLRELNDGSSRAGTAVVKEQESAIAVACG